MNKLIAPLIIIAILSDVACMTFYTFVSDKLYYIGESCVYATWVLAFWLRNKYHVSYNQEWLIDTLLLLWIPFCLNSVYKNIRGTGAEKSETDYLFFITSAVILMVQVLRRLPKKIPREDN